MNDDIYVEFEKSADPSQLLKGNVEMSIAPNLNLKSSGDSDNLWDVSLEWQKDY